MVGDHCTRYDTKTTYSYLKYYNKHTTRTCCSNYSNLAQNPWSLIMVPKMKKIYSAAIMEECMTDGQTNRWADRQTD